jgi:hypothetical protein
MSTPNRTQNSEKSFPEPLIFGTVFTNEKFVPIRAEIWSMFNKVQVIELVFITHLCSTFLSTLLLIIYLTFCRFITISP